MKTVKLREISTGRNYTARVVDSVPENAIRDISCVDRNSYDYGYYDFYLLPDAEDPNYLEYIAVWQEYADDVEDDVDG